MSNSLSMTNMPQYTMREEIANSVTHGLGVLIGVAQLVLLCVYSSMMGNVWHIVSCAVFGTSLILLYSASMLYHAISIPSTKKIFRMLDHSAIFLLIAGTYTPFTLVSLRGPIGWTLFGCIWGIAILGMIMQTMLLKQKSVVNAVLYLIMGWFIIFAFKPLMDALPMGGMIFLVAGGLTYSLGTIFYVCKKIPYHHAIWHLFVLIGSLLHFFSIFFYVIPIFS